LVRNAQSGCMKPFHRLIAVPLPVLVTGVAALHRLLPCASLRPPPVLYTPQGTDVPAGSDWSELPQLQSVWVLCSACMLSCFVHLVHKREQVIQNFLQLLLPPLPAIT
jgi:hypothetical protein